MLEVCIGIAVIIVFIILVFVIYSNRFLLAIIKIDEAESNIDVLLARKLDLLQRIVPIVKNELKIEEFLVELNVANSTELNHFDLNELLRNQYNELFKTLDENEKLFKSEALNMILRDLNDNEEAIIGSIKFYNDNVVLFNHLVSSFPSRIVALFKRYKRKVFYSDENKEMYEILAD